MPKKQKPLTMPEEAKIAALGRVEEDARRDGMREAMEMLASRPRFEVIVAADGRVKIPRGTMALHNIRPGMVLQLVVMDCFKPATAFEMMQDIDSPKTNEMIDNMLADPKLQESMKEAKIPPEKARAYAKMVAMRMMGGVADAIDEAKKAEADAEGGED